MAKVDPFQSRRKERLVVPLQCAVELDPKEERAHLLLAAALTGPGRGNDAFSEWQTVLVRSWRELGRFSTVLAGMLLASLPAIDAAQVDMGSISGAVHDPSGAAISGAKVTLTNDDTGIALSTIAGAEGQYSFRPVKIGRYSISALAAGFKSFQQKNVTVDVQQNVNLDLSLALGATTETVVVNDAPPLLQTLDASVGQVIQEKALDNLPLNGRNFTFLAQLSAGVTQGPQDARGLGSSGSFAANGLRPAQNNYLLDGYLLWPSAKLLSISACGFFQT